MLWNHRKTQKAEEEKQMEVMSGYAGNLLRVNLSNKTHHVEHLDEELLNLFFGEEGYITTNWWINTENP